MDGDADIHYQRQVIRSPYCQGGARHFNVVNIDFWADENMIDPAYGVGSKKSALRAMIIKGNLGITEMTPDPFANL